MNETNNQLLAAARTYVADIYQHRVKPEFVFHNIEHTEDVAETCSHIADYYHCSEEDRLVLLLAAWFHDTGYSSGQTEGHEDVSVQMATQFLTAHSVDSAIIQRVASCIQATRMPQTPVSIVEKILCDADLQHIATGDFRARNSLLKQERENLLEHKIDKKEWRRDNMEFLQTHKFFTDYGQNLLEPKKEENLQALSKKKETKKTTTEKPERNFPYTPAASVAVDKEGQKNTERGVQTMFRTTSHNHLELSGMADNKAHIMITVNSIILSVTVSYLIAKIAFYQQYIIPSAILILTSLICVTFSILATRPSVNIGKFTEEDIRNKKTNLLFFGNFHNMQLTDYQWGMHQMIQDKEYLYNTMIMDIYFLGVVVARKYRFLRFAYTVFMVGLIIAVFAFGIAALVSKNDAINAGASVLDY